MESRKQSNGKQNLGHLSLGLRIRISDCEILRKSTPIILRVMVKVELELTHQIDFALQHRGACQCKAYLEFEKSR